MAKGQERKRRTGGGSVSMLGVQRPSGVTMRKTIAASLSARALASLTFQCSPAVARRALPRKDDKPRCDTRSVTLWATHEAGSLAVSAIRHPFRPGTPQEYTNCRAELPTGGERDPYFWRGGASVPGNCLGWSGWHGAGTLGACCGTENPRDGRAWSRSLHDYFSFRF